MKVIGAGVGRTGTHSLKLALNELGLGPCHHMEAVIQNMPVQVPLWREAADGNGNWQAIYEGFNSAVDWPTAAFFKTLVTIYPSAKFVLTHRSPESWADSFTSTIYRFLGIKNEVPPEMKDWLEMAADVIAKTGFPEGLDREQLIQRFIAHNEAVKAAIPADRLLVFEASQGWEPLCAFLGKPVPGTPFPRSNNREEFWERFA